MAEIVPLRLTVALTDTELVRVSSGDSVVMQASSGQSVIFEIEVVRRDKDEPPRSRQRPSQPAPVPAPTVPPTLPLAVGLVATQSSREASS